MLAEIASIAADERGLELVALSGGVDSAVVLALAAETLGADRVVAITGRSSSLPGHDEADAARVAARVGVEHRYVDTRELEDPRYRANAGDRCYHCRVELFGRLESFARDHGFAAAAYGAIVDDLGDVRGIVDDADALQHRPRLPATGRAGRSHSLARTHPAPGA